MGGTNGVNGSGNKFQLPNFWSKPSLHAAKAEKANAATPIKFAGLDTIKRENLDELSPYAAMGVKFSHKPNPVTQEFAGEFGINPNKSLEEQLPQSQVDNAKTLAKIYAQVGKDYNEVAARLATKEGPFAELFT